MDTVDYKHSHPRPHNITTTMRANVFGMGRQSHIDAQGFFEFPLLEAFGMTEIGMALYMPEEAVDMAGSRSCGLVAPFRECKVMIDLETQAGSDEVGELWVKGQGVIKSYFKNPVANAAGFHDGWFRSGDLFSTDANGFFYYRGRLKDMVRRSGENIAAQEVEAAVDNCAIIVESGIVAVPDDMRGEEVKAFVVCKEGVNLKCDVDALEEIFQVCRLHLAPFKIPRYVQQIAEFPRTGSGKIDKTALLKEWPDLLASTYDRTENKWL
jgi:long-chain acyl-CoA synthetase